jgi:precorrin-2 dehydrogenase/sirohydrochlorin ferrochelatase
VYPIMLNMRRKSCLVVGGGGVALRKLEALLVNEAHVTVVSPEPIDPLEELAAAGLITLKRRHYLHGEAALYYLVIAATDDRDTIRGVYE